MYQYLDQQLEDAARTVPLLLTDHYHHQGMSAGDQTDEQGIHNIIKLSQYTAKNDINFIYTLILKNNKVVFSSSSATKESLALGGNINTYFTPYNNTNTDIYGLFKKRQKSFIEYRDQWGAFRQVFIPLYSADGLFYFSVAEMSISHREALLNKEFYKTLVITILFLLITSLTYLASVHNIKKITRQLAQNEERLSLGLTISKLNWFDHNILTGEFSVSDGYYHLLGYESLKFYSILDEWLSCVHKDDEKSVLSHYQTCLETGGPCTVDYRIQTKAGKWLWFRSIAKVVEKDKTNSPARIIGSHLDITHDKDNEQQLRLSAEAAEKANQAKSEFLSSMSHELRTPLNAILGFSQLLENDLKTPLTPKQKEKTGYVINAGNHLLALINEVLSLSAIEAGKTKVSIEAVNLADIVNESVSLVDSLAIQNEVSLNIVTQELTSCVLADYVRLKQVLLNLLSNAIKYNRRGGTVHIEWTLTHHDSIKMSISDTGIGIPLKNQAKVFDAFNRLGRENSDIEGTGVGLMVTKNLVELMQGKIDFESVEHKGTTFWFELPLAEPVNVTAGLIELCPIIEEPFKLTKKLKQSVLYVEDNPINQQLIEAFFEKREESKLYLANSAEIGWEMLSKQVFDLILMDIHLPKMNGIELTKRLKRLPHFANVPVIAVTAAAMKQDLDEAKGVFDNYITKPINMSELTAVLQDYQ
ncbi:MAG: ATP-binding protein [Methylococcales bacterium]|nr:ATP-binding protein [Methylococcales bacterium]